MKPLTSNTVELGLPRIDKPQDDRTGRSHGKSEPVRRTGIPVCPGRNGRRDERSDKGRSLADSIEQRKEEVCLGCRDDFGQKRDLICVPSGHLKLLESITKLL